MLSLQIILTYKSRLKYGNQKNRWKVSINCKTPVVGFVKPPSESRPREEMEMGILVTLWVSGCCCVSGWQKRLGGSGIQHRDREPLRAAEHSVSQSHLSPRTPTASNRSLPSINLESSADIPCLLIRGRLWGIRLPLSGSRLWSEQATEPLTFHLAEAYTLEKSWQSIHFAPSWSRLMSDWWDPPSLMLYSFESALLWKKFYPSKLKRNISASSC